MEDNTTKQPSAFLKIEVANLSDWAKSVLELQETERHSLVAQGEVFGDRKWVFRGQSNAAWQITSSLERVNHITSQHLRDPERYFRAAEQIAIAEFKRRAHSLVENDNLSNLEWTMLMRHYGVPTRLVDFTEVPFLALFFALDDESTEDFSVWAVARESMSDWYSQSKNGSIIPEINELFKTLHQDKIAEIINRNESKNPSTRPLLDFVRAFKHTRDNAHKRIVENRHFAERLFSADVDDILPEMQKLPAVYLYAEKPDARQRVQRGLFLMSSCMSSPFMEALKRSLNIAVETEATCLRLEECMGEGSKHKSTMQNAKLLQFVFKGSLRQECRAFLNSVGISPSSVYPDLFGIAIETKNLISLELSPAHDFSDYLRNHLLEILAGKPISLDPDQENSSPAHADAPCTVPSSMEGRN